MTERELLMLMERDPQLAMALMYIAAMGEQERRTQMSNYDKFKNFHNFSPLD